MMSGTYDLRLVVLSYLVAVFASYTALDLAGRVSVARGSARPLWLAGGAVALGIGIWSMHFIGMLAFALPMSTAYDPITVLVSLLAAVAASLVALYTMSRPVARVGYLIAGGLSMGVGIAAMHYIGMLAMRMEAAISYDAPTVLLSLLIAVGASFAALWLAFTFRVERADVARWRWLKIASAMIMGGAIAGMPYTGMAAARFQSTEPVMTHTASISDLPLGIAIVAATCVVLGFTLLTSLFDRRLNVQSRAVDESSQRFQSLFQHNSDAVLTYDLHGTLLDANDAAVQLSGCSHAELIAGRFVHLLSSSDRAAVTALLQRAVAGTPQMMDLRITPVGREPVLLNTRLVPILISAQVVGVYIIATDITKRAMALDALTQSDAALRSALAQQQTLIATIQNLSTPVLPVHDGVLLLPLIGQITADRSEQIMQVLLGAVERHRARTVILDITGVSLIDTAVAAHLLQAIDAARLLGAASIMVGIAPEVAQTLVGLGVNLSAITIRSTLQDGIAHAIGTRH